MTYRDLKQFEINHGSSGDKKNVDPIQVFHDMYNQKRPRPLAVSVNNNKALSHAQLLDLNHFWDLELIDLMEGWVSLKKGPIKPQEVCITVVKNFSPQEPTTIFHSN